MSGERGKHGCATDGISILSVDAGITGGSLQTLPGEELA